MSHSRAFSKKEKIFGAVVLALAATALIVSYTQARSSENAVLLAQVSEEDLKNQKNQIRNQKDYAKGILQELKDIKKASKNAVDTSKVEGLVNQLSQCIQKTSVFVGAENFWDDWKNCSDINEEIETLLRDELWPKRDCAMVKGQIDDRRKHERKDLNSQVKDILRNDKTIDVSGLHAILANIDAQFEKANKINVATCDSDGKYAFDEIQSELGSLFQDFYNASEELNQVSNQKRQFEEGKKDFKNIKKNCERDKAREFKSFVKGFEKAKQKGTVSEEQQAAFDNLQSIYVTLCTDLIAEIQAALDANNGDDFNNARNDFWNEDRKFLDAMSENRDIFEEQKREVEEQKQKIQELKHVDQDLKVKEREMKRMKKELVRIKKQYDKAVKKFADRSERKELLRAMASLIGQAESVVAKIETLIADARAAAPEDPESYWSDYREELNDLQNEFFELQDTVNRIGGIFGELKNVGRELKRAEKELKQYEDTPELHARLKELLYQGQATLAQVWTNLVSDPEGAEDLLRDLQEMGGEWDEAIREHEEEN